MGAKSAANPFWLGLGAGALLFAGSLGLRGLAHDRPAAASTAASPSPPSIDDDLRARQLLLPVEGYDVQQLRDSFHEPRSGHRHKAIDLLAPRGTIVRAVDSGIIRQQLSGGTGGLAIFQVDRTGRYGYYYAHLERHAPFLHEGQAVEKGAVLGYVGTSGNAPSTAPHLHFAIFRLRDADRWWEGEAINPYSAWAKAR